MAKSSNSKAGAKSRQRAGMGAATDKLAELANNPVARSMLAAGLVAAAAALTTNEKVRQGARKASREALDGAEAAADNASKIGAAIVTAATEAVRKLLVSPAKGGASATRKSTAAKPGAGRAAAAKGMRKKASSNKSQKPAAAGAKKAKPARGKSKTARSSAKAASVPTMAAAPGTVTGKRASKPLTSGKRGGAKKTARKPKASAPAGDGAGA